MNKTMNLKLTRVILSIWFVSAGVLMIFAYYGIDSFNLKENYSYLFIMGGSLIFMDYLLSRS